MESKYMLKSPKIIVLSIYVTFCWDCTANISLNYL